MKKLIYGFLIASMLFGGGVSFAYDEGSFINRKEISGGYASDPVRVYQLVRYSENGQNGVSLSSGDVVVWDCVSDDGVSVNVASAASSVDAVAGVVVSATVQTSDGTGAANAQDGSRNWGYIQTYGLCTVVNITAGPASAGGTLRAANTARYATSDIASLVASQTSRRQLGFAYDASSDGQAEAFINTR